LAALGLTDLLALIEQHCARLRDLGSNPAIIVDKMRPHTQRIWQRFSLEERLEFIRHYAARWNVARHRIAPEIYITVGDPVLAESACHRKPEYPPGQGECASCSCFFRSWL